MKRPLRTGISVAAALGAAAAATVTLTSLPSAHTTPAVARVVTAPAPIAADPSLAEVAALRAHLAAVHHRAVVLRGQIARMQAQIAAARARAARAAQPAQPAQPARQSSPTDTALAPNNPGPSPAQAATARPSAQARQSPVRDQPGSTAPASSAPAPSQSSGDSGGDGTGAPGGGEDGNG